MGKSTTPPHRKRRLVAVVLAALIGAGSHAGAQTLTVEIGPTQFNTWLTQFNTYLQQIQAYTEYGLQAQRWYQTYQHFQQQLVRMQGIIKGFGLPAGQTLRPVDPNYLVADRCGGGISLGTVLHALAPKRSDDVVRQQRDICIQLQRLQNTKYNETVELLTKTMPQMEAQTKAVAAMRARDNDNGTVDASAQAALQTLADMQKEMQEWNGRMDAYDGLAAALRDSQRQLAQIALKGERNPIGTVVKTNALKAALKVGN